MGVLVRQRPKGKGNPWWVFINHEGKRHAKKIGDKAAAEAVASHLISSLSDAVDLYKSLTGNYQFLPITETGCVDTIMSFSNQGNVLNVNIVSDAGSEVPIPGSVLLLGSGLLCMAAYRRRKLA
jgi:hypothetical protein